MFPTFQEIAKYIGDKLVIALLVLVATVYRNYLLERYKVSSSVSVYDSNEFVKRLESLWAKAYEIEGETYELEGLYEKLDWQRHVPIAYEGRDFRKEIEKQELVINDKIEEFFDIMRKNKFYLGESVTDHVFLYVTLALSAVNYERQFDFDVMREEHMVKVIGTDDRKEQMKESLSKEREKIASLKESTRKQMEKFRFGYSSARKLSLEYKP